MKELNTLCNELKKKYTQLYNTMYGTSGTHPGGAFGEKKNLRYDNNHPTKDFKTLSVDKGELGRSKCVIIESEKEYINMAEMAKWSDQRSVGV